MELSEQSNNATKSLGTTDVLGVRIRAFLADDVQVLCLLAFSSRMQGFGFRTGAPKPRLTVQLWEPCALHAETCSLLRSHQTFELCHIILCCMSLNSTDMVSGYGIMVSHLPSAQSILPNSAGPTLVLVHGLFVGEFYVGRERPIRFT